MINFKNFFKFILLLDIIFKFYIINLLRLLNIIYVIIKIRLFIILKLNIKEV